MSEIIFEHTGNQGDALFSLHFCKDIIDYHKIDKAYYVLVYGKKATYAEGHPDGDVQMTQKSAEFLKPFLEECGFFKQIDIVSWNDFIQIKGQVNNLVMLDAFRNMPLNFFGEDIRSYYYALSTNHFNQDFSKNLFEGKFEGDNRAKDKFLICYTERVNSHFVSPLQCGIKDYLDRIAFVGLDSEYERFCKMTDATIPRFKITDMADAARLMKGSRGVFGNQGGLLSLAEMLKVDRLLISPEYMQLNGKVMIGPCTHKVTGGNWYDHIMVPQNCEKITKAFMEH